MSKILSKIEKKDRRHRRIRSKVKGTSERPRLVIFKSNRDIYAQIIDDDKGVTLISASSMKIKGKSMLEKSKIVGESIAEIAKKSGIEKVVFDRGGYLYTGKVQNFADSARKGGLIF
jgi:large subunit ribosomal protein L18